jgi:hypothetical protein
MKIKLNLLEGKSEGMLHLNGVLKNKQNIIQKKMEKIVIPYADKIQNFIKNKIKIKLGNS